MRITTWLRAYRLYWLAGRQEKLAQRARVFGDWEVAEAAHERAMSLRNRARALEGPST